MIFCHQCGKEIPSNVVFCPHCGAKNILQPTTQQAVPSQQPGSGPPLTPGTIPNPVYVSVGLKSPGTATALAGLFGLIGLWGLGHIYVNKVGLGVVYLILGLILEILSWVVALPLFLGSYIASFITTDLFHLPSQQMFFIAGVILLMSVGGWLAQTYEAYAYARKWNKALQDTGKVPW